MIAIAKKLKLKILIIKNKIQEEIKIN